MAERERESNGRITRRDFLKGVIAGAASEQINEFISHGIFGASVELTRRFMWKRLG